MKFVNVALARLFQFIVFVIFTFAVLVYFGTFLLLPLNILVQLINLFALIGLPNIIAAVLAAALLAYIGYLVYRMPDLYKTVMDIGVELVMFGYSQVKRFEKIVKSIKGISSDTSTSTA